METLYSAVEPHALLAGEQYKDRLPAGQQVLLRDLSFQCGEPVYIFNGLRYAVRRTASGWETTGAVR